MRPSTWLPLTLLVTLAAGPARAEPPAPYRALADLGRLNGLALHCKYLEEVRRMKAAVVESAPKERSYGLAFDEATNQAFLEALRGGPCPGPAGLAQEVDGAIAALRRAFAAPGAQP